MRPLGVSSVSSFTNLNVWSLTYDETDHTATHNLVRSESYPHITPSGFEGDGYSAKYNVAVSGYGSGASLFASVSMDGTFTHASVQTVAALVDNSNQPKLGLYVTQDARETTLPNLTVSTYDGSLKSQALCRKNWRYEGRTPELAEGGYSALPQGIESYDSEHILVSVHFQETLSRVYKMKISDWTVVGQFDFPSPYVHIAAISKRSSDSSWWFADYATGMLMKVDLTSSFSTGNAVIDVEYDMSDIPGMGAIAWYDDGVDEYLLVLNYLVSGTPYMYVVDPALIIDGNSFLVTERYKRFVIEQRCQGVYAQGGTVYVSYNRYSIDGIATGKITSYDIATAIASLADDGALTLGTTWYAPSQYVEDLTIDNDGRLWTGTEGLISVNDVSGWNSFWSTDLSESFQQNNVMLNYTSGSDVTVYINNRLFGTISLGTPTVTPTYLIIGGNRGASSGFDTSHYTGFVKTVMLSPTGAIPSSVYPKLVSGFYEPSSLGVYTATLTNPGAETGDTSGWTAEAGGLGIRSSNPLPYNGSYYFTGGTVVQTIARQRINLETLTGLSGATLDASDVWVKARCWQSNFDALNDAGTIGVRTTDGSFVQTTLTYATSWTTAVAKLWYRRSIGIDVVANDRNVDVLLKADRTSGTNNDSYFDDVSLVVYVK